MARRELEVKADWHVQVHRSKVTALSFSAGGSALWSGGDAAVPKPTAAEGDEPLVAAVDPSTGTTLRRAQNMPTCNVRLLLPLPGGKGVLCAAGDGTLLTLSVDMDAVVASSALPGMQAEAGAAAAAGKQQEGATAEADAAQQEETAGRGTAAGPEFVEEAGYRGHREGYLFREGALGPGYYRKDVVRRHCASAAPVPPTAVPSQLQQQQQHAPADAPAASPACSEACSEGQLSGEEARRYIQRLLRAPPSMHSVIANADGTLLFTASLGPSDCSVRVWRLQPGGKDSKAALQPELYCTLAGHTAPVLSLALSPDGSLLYSGSHDCTVRVWSTADWHCLRELKGHGGGVRALAAGPDGATLYTAAADNTIRAWSTQHWVCLRTMHGRHEDTTWPACLALSPDGSLLASGSTGPFGASTIMVFQAGSGGSHEAGASLASLAQLGYHQRGGVSSLLFSPDGATLYSGASDGTLAAWRLRWRDAPGGGGGLRRGFL